VTKLFSGNVICLSHWMAEEKNETWLAPVSLAQTNAGELNNNLLPDPPGLIITGHLSRLWDATVAGRS
jgi:hypothetical protein